MLRPVEKESSQVESGDIRKTCEFHPNKKGHTIEKCTYFKKVVHRLLDMGSIANSWGECIIHSFPHNYKLPHNFIRALKGIWLVTGLREKV